LKAHLFYRLLVLLDAISLVTLLGVTNVIAIRNGHLTVLVTFCLIELEGTVIAIFKSANFLAPEKTPITAEEDKGSIAYALVA
jgi:hypothetical protein